MWYEEHFIRFRDKNALFKFIRLSVDGRPIRRKSCVFKFILLSVDVASGLISLRLLFFNVHRCSPLARCNPVHAFMYNNFIQPQRYISFYKHESVLMNHFQAPFCTEDSF